MKSKISFLGRRAPLKPFNLNTVKRIVTDFLLAKPYKTANLSYLLVTKKTMLELNKTYLSHDYDTDIITFDLSEEPGSLDAEIYICPETVYENAARFNTTNENELLRVIFHGMLHLCGYNDKTTAQQKVMRGMEEHCLNLYQNSVNQ